MNCREFDFCFPFKFLRNMLMVTGLLLSFQAEAQTKDRCVPQKIVEKRKG